MRSAAAEDDTARTMTLEAFADTIMPGEKRFPGDHAIAGVSEGGGAVAAGAIAMMELPAGGLAPALAELARVLNGHARQFAEDRGTDLDESVPPFVALAYDQRAALVLALTKPGNPGRQLWANLATFSNMAFDTAGHMSTHDALAAGHPGLVTMGFAPPNPDGLWRFPKFSYRRALASLHPNTTASGSPE
jgi:hypothetical protein